MGKENHEYQKEKVNRNITIDIVRGLAIVIVMIGHVISTNTVGYENTTIFNVIWSIQMPLFMIISGYVNKYSIQLTSQKLYFKYISKRFLTLFIPWIMWTFIIKGVLIEGYSYYTLIDYVSWIITHMDVGYWFLFSLWIISLVYSSSNYIACKNEINESKRVIYTVIFSVLFSLFLFIIGAYFGFEYLGIKLTLYYLPFYYVGYICGKFEQTIINQNWFIEVKRVLYIIITFIYVLLIINFNLYSSTDSIGDIIIRITASSAGCLIVFYNIDKVSNQSNGIILKTLTLAGQNSLELYVVHGYFVSVFKNIPSPTLLTIDGIVVIMINFGVMLFFSILVIYIISINKWSRLFLFGKK